MELTDSADYHVKVVGHQWYWEYEYYMRSQFKRIDELSVRRKDSHVRGRCAQVFKALGAESCFPFSLSEDAEAGDLHLNFDSYGVPAKGVIEEVISAEDSDMRSYWPFLGQGGVTQPLFIPVNKTTEVKVCTADVLHS